MFRKWKPSLKKNREQSARPTRIPGKYKMGGECESCPDPPSKGQPVKKQPRNSAEAASKTNEPALAEVQENIIYIISGKSTKG